MLCVYGCMLLENVSLRRVLVSIEVPTVLDLVHEPCMQILLLVGRKSSTFRCFLENSNARVWRALHMLAYLYYRTELA